MKTILVPVDFSAVSRDVVAAAIRLARLTQSRLLLVHVVQPTAIFVSDFGPVYENMAPYLAALDESADRQLARLKSSLRSDKVAVSTLRLNGSPGLCILEQAKQRGVSYIVLGSHGHGAFYDLVVGSTASLVLKRSTCPVMVVPAREMASPKARRKA